MKKIQLKKMKSFRVEETHIYDLINKNKTVHLQGLLR